MIKDFKYIANYYGFITFQDNHRFTLGWYKFNISVEILYFSYGKYVPNYFGASSMLDAIFLALREFDA